MNYFDSFCISFLMFNFKSTLFLMRITFVLRSNQAESSFNRN